MLLFPFKLRDSAASAFVTMDYHAHMECKLEEKDPMNAVGNPFLFFDLKIPDEITCL